MDDLISRQTAIDRINKQREHLQPDIDPQDKIGDAAYRICAEFIERLPSARPEQRWIPCSERLPSKADHTDDMVLVCYRNGSVRFNTYMNGWAQGNPVAWMPLPEPYKRGEQDGNQEEGS